MMMMLMMLMMMRPRGHGHWHHHRHRRGRWHPGVSDSGCPDVGALRPWWRMHAGLHRRIFLGFGVASLAAAIAFGGFWERQARAT